MPQLHWIRKLVTISLAATFLAPSASVAQDIPDRDTREIASYVLTEAGLARFTQATRNLGTAAKPSSGDCEDQDNPPSLDEAAARLDAIPGARTALKSAGMAPREYIVFSFAVFQSGMAAWALDQPGGELPPGISMANVNFYRAHEAAIQDLDLKSQSGDCDDADGGSDEVDDE